MSGDARSETSRGPKSGASATKKFAGRVLRLLALSYVGILIVLLALENKFIFVPTPASVEWTEPGDSRIRDVELAAATGERIHAWWLPKADGRGAILFNHGNAGNLSFRGGTLGRWSEHLNASILIYDYPGYGKSSGSPSERSCTAAAEAAWDWLVAERHFQSDQIVLVGESLGGAIAAGLAARYDCRAIVLVKAFTSIPDMAQYQYPWLPARYFVRTQLDTAGHLAQCRRPVFLVHGVNDSIVPCQFSQRLYAAAHEPKEILCLPANDHNDPLPDEFFSRLAAFLDRHAPLKQ